MIPSPPFRRKTPDAASSPAAPGLHYPAQPPPVMADGHVDLPYYLMRHAPDCTFRDLRVGPFTPEKAAASGVRLFCAAMYCEDRFNGEGSFAKFQNLFRFTLDRLGEDLIIREALSLTRLLQDKERLGSVLLLENADPLVGHLEEVPRLRERGVFLVGLTHIGRNRIADGNSVSRAEGITREGLCLIQAIHEHGLVIDAAHLHPQCFWDLLERYSGTLVTTHTGIREVCDLPRNIDFEQARAILERHGMIGVTFNPEMLSLDGRADIGLVFRHLDLLVQRFGPDGIGIGSDLCGFDPTAQGLEDIAAMGALRALMRDNGYGDEACEKILGLNWISFLTRIL